MYTQFYTNEVQTAAQKAYNHYTRVLQRYAGDSPEHLGIARERCLKNMNAAMDEANRAAELGDKSTAGLQLAFLLAEWAAYTAYSDLLDKGGSIDPADQGGRDQFQLNLNTILSTRLAELQNSLTAATQKETWTQERIYRERSENLFVGYKELVSEHRSSLNQAHEYNGYYMQAALDGAKQAQDGARWMMKGVEDLNNQAANHAIQLSNQAANHTLWMQSQVQRYSVEVMNSAKDTQKQYNEQLRQNLPKEMAELQERMQTRSIIRRGLTILAIVGGFLASYPLGYWYVTHILFPH